MPVFRYTAVTQEGQRDKGLVEADSPRDARARLRSRQLTALSVDVMAEKAGDRSRSRLSNAQLALLTRQYAALLDAGLTAEQALNALTEQAIEPAIADLLIALRAEVRSGNSLATAMSRQPGVFPELYRALVQGGEDAGALPRVMAELADHLDEREEIRQKLSLALLYPATIGIVALLVISGLMLYVVPQIAGVFSQTRQDLPWMTVALLGFNGFLRHVAPWVLLVVVTASYGFHHLYRRGTFRRRVQVTLLKLPLIGHLLRLNAGARFASTLAILLAGGVPLLRALDSVADSASLDVFGDSTRRAADRVREGASLSRALAVENHFPPLLLHFIASGETSGELAVMLDHASKQLQSEMDFRLRWLGGVLEPALIISMGLVVLMIVLAVLMPIIEVNHLVR